MNIFIPSQRGRSYARYENDIAVVVNKTGITLVGKSNELLTTTGFVSLYSDKTDWAIKPVERSRTAYTVGTWSKKEEGERINKYHISATLFIKSNNLQIGGLYIGRVKDGMVVFSKLATELI